MEFQNVSNNQLESLGAQSLGEILSSNNHLVSLSAAGMVEYSMKLNVNNKMGVILPSGNGFLEKDAYHIVDALKVSTHIWVGTLGKGSTLFSVGMNDWN